MDSQDFDGLPTDELVAELARKHKCSSGLAEAKARRAAEILTLGFEDGLFFLLEAHDNTVWTETGDSP
ncbi:MAG TPA: hypothetical protein VFX17_00060 [Patescibacteria group bacterium]|nr:hypothetical protein [Patescibacteria group bacterium]